MKNIIFKILLYICACVGCLMIAGCSNNCSDIRRRVTFYEQGNFRYAIQPVDAEPDDELYIMLDGLTEAGKTKEVVIIPEKIDGIPVTWLSDRSWMSYFGQFESDKLKSVYVMGTSNCHEGYTFGGSPNLEKIVLQKAVKWFSDEYYSVFENYPMTITYVPSYAYQNDFSEISVYANISYMYNFKNAENEGYYWVDNFDYGTKIEYIPENPEREGYIFGGWFKEPECKNIWNFDKDTLPEQKFDEDGREIYQETRLYAKWIEQ